MRNQFAGPCRDCGAQVAAQAGYFEKTSRAVQDFDGGKWHVRCIPCTAKGKVAAGRPLSHAQRKALSA